MSQNRKSPSKTLSKDTQNLINQMMKDKKITWKKQKEITKAMSVGQALPVERKLSNTQ
jgi:hypothetical protein